METLVVVAQHRNQYYNRVKSNEAARFEGSPSRHFRDIYCRTFQSVGEILPTHFKSFTSPVTGHNNSSVPDSSSHLPKTPSSSVKSPANFHLADNMHYKNAPRSSPIPINTKTLVKEMTFNDEELGVFNGNLSSSELWAGPTYSNSPPPSSLPIPKFSMKPKRTVSLDLPLTDSHAEVHPISKSAPASPTREVNPSAIDLFLSTDSATKTLRRILNLDVADEYKRH